MMFRNVCDRILSGKRWLVMIKRMRHRQIELSKSEITYMRIWAVNKRSEVITQHTSRLGSITLHCSPKASIKY